MLLRGSIYLQYTVNVRLLVPVGTATLSVTSVPSSWGVVTWGGITAEEQTGFYITAEEQMGFYITAEEQMPVKGSEQGFPDLRHLSPHTVGSAHRARDLQLKWHRGFVFRYLSDSSALCGALSSWSLRTGKCHYLPGADRQSFTRAQIPSSRCRDTQDNIYLFIRLFIYFLYKMQYFVERWAQSSSCITVP